MLTAPNYTTGELVVAIAVPRFDMIGEVPAFFAVIIDHTPHVDLTFNIIGESCFESHISSEPLIRANKEKVISGPYKAPFVFDIRLIFDRFIHLKDELDQGTTFKLFKLESNELMRSSQIYKPSERYMVM